MKTAGARSSRVMPSILAAWSPRTTTRSPAGDVTGVEEAALGHPAVDRGGQSGPVATTVRVWSVTRVGSTRALERT